MYFLEQIKQQYIANIFAYQENAEGPGDTPEQPSKPGLEGPERDQLTELAGQSAEAARLDPRVSDGRDALTNAERGTGTGTPEGSEGESMGIETGRNLEVDPEVAKLLAGRGITQDLDNNVGGKPEAILMAEFIGKNPEVDGKDLIDRMSAGMTPEEYREFISDMTPEEYEKYINDTLIEMTELEEIEAMEGPLGSVNEDGSSNFFAPPSVGGNPTRPSSYGSGRSGTMEGVSNIPNTELLQLSEGIAKRLQVEPAAIKAVVSVESAGKINATRFEPHIFKRAQNGNYGEGNRTMLATSYGAFQIMGFNYETAGFSSVEAMVDGMKTPEGQINAFASFIESNPNIHRALQAKDWPAFAHGYNGPAYRQNNYDNKMAAAYRKYSSEAPTV